jgi:shikimate dehydrogenase
MTQQTITGKTSIVGLIGWPVGHSVSPPMHNAAFDALSLDWRYVPLPVDVDSPGLVERAVAGLHALGLRGANVTVPHKQNVMPFLDELTPAADAIGAVNTIVVGENGSLLGDNTDARGFVADLRAHQVSLTGTDALVLGAGGSARAVVYGLAEAGCTSITLLNRTLDKATDLAAAIQPHFPGCAISALPFPEGIAQVASSAGLIVNCTSMGMTPNTNTLPWDEAIAFQASQTVYDLVYNPPRTRLLQMAEADGARAIGGLGMLIWQGAIAFELWTGQQPPVDVMEAAALAAFGRRG